MSYRYIGLQMMCRQFERSFTIVHASSASVWAEILVRTLRKLLFLSVKNMFLGSKYPKTILLNFENRSSAREFYKGWAALSQKREGQPWATHRKSYVPVRPSPQSGRHHHKKLSDVLTSRHTIQLAYRKNSNYWNALGEKMSVYRGTRVSRWSACGPNENLKDQLSCCR